MLPTLSLGAYRSNADAEELLAVPSTAAEHGDRVISGLEPLLPLKKRKILIVQGDWESGMSLLALDLKDAGHEVGKVFFCAPDVVYKFRGVRTHLFRKPLADFEAWLRELIQREGYDTFFLYK